jgi:hypothetical protein
VSAGQRPSPKTPLRTGPFGTAPSPVWGLLLTIPVSHPPVAPLLMCSPGRKKTATSLSPEWAGFASCGWWGRSDCIGVGVVSSSSASIADVEVGTEWRAPLLPLWAVKYLRANRLAQVIVALLNSPSSASAAADEKRTPSATAATTAVESLGRAAVFNAVRPLLLLLATSLNGACATPREYSGK